MLLRIAEGKDVSGSRPADYHVVGVRSVQDAAERHWDFLKGAWRALRDAIGDAGHDPSGLAIENWLLPLFEEHGFGRLPAHPDGIQSDDREATSSRSRTGGSTSPSTWSAGTPTWTTGRPAAGCRRSRCCRSA